MLGAIVGDVIGSVYELVGPKGYDLPLITEHSRFTDDTVASCAIACAILGNEGYGTSLRNLCKEYPGRGYGEHFQQWVFEHREAWDNWDNDAAMRTSPIGYAFDDQDKVLSEAQKACVVSHTHKEAIKGAQATALAVYMARTGFDKYWIEKSITEKFGYNLKRKLSDISSSYSFSVACQDSVPEAIICFLEANDFENTMRNVLSLGGDTDTIGAIAGAIAFAYWKTIPEAILLEVEQRVDKRLWDIAMEFHQQYRTELDEKAPYFADPINIDLTLSLNAYQALKDNLNAPYSRIRKTGYLFDTMRLEGNTLSFYCAVTQHDLNTGKTYRRYVPQFCVNFSANNEYCKITSTWLNPEKPIIAPTDALEKGWHEAKNHISIWISALAGLKGYSKPSVSAYSGYTGYTLRAIRALYELSDVNLERRALNNIFVLDASIPDYLLFYKWIAKQPTDKLINFTKLLKQSRQCNQWRLLHSMLNSAMPLLRTTAHEEFKYRELTADTAEFLVSKMKSLWLRSEIIAETGNQDNPSVHIIAAILRHKRLWHILDTDTLFTAIRFNIKGALQFARRTQRKAIALLMLEVRLRMPCYLDNLSDFGPMVRTLCNELGKLRMVQWLASEQPNDNVLGIWLYYYLEDTIERQQIEQFLVHSDQQVCDAVNKVLCSIDLGTLRELAKSGNYEAIFPYLKSPYEAVALHAYFAYRVSKKTIPLDILLALLQLSHISEQSKITLIRTILNDVLHSYQSQAKDVYSSIILGNYQDTVKLNVIAQLTENNFSDCKDKISDLIKRLAKGFSSLVDGQRIRQRLILDNLFQAYMRVGGDYEILDELGEDNFTKQVLGIDFVPKDNPDEN